VNERFGGARLPNGLERFAEVLAFLERWRAVPLRLPSRSQRVPFSQWSKTMRG
jgi:hypothetical protein